MPYHDGAVPGGTELVAADLVVAVGTRATQALFEQPSGGGLLSVLVPKRAFDQLESAAAKRTGAGSAGRRQPPRCAAGPGAARWRRFSRLSVPLAQRRLWNYSGP